MYEQRSDLAEEQFYMGNIFLLGEGVEKDLNLAVRLFESAGVSGHVAAQYSMGLMYEFGQGVTADINTAEMWYEAAAKSGYHLAKEKLNKLYIKTGRTYLINERNINNSLMIN